MRGTRGMSLAAVLTAALAAAASAQDIKPARQPETPGLHRMEIVVGSSRTVQYFSPGASTSELAALRDLANAENELDYVDRLMALRRQMLITQEMLEPARRMAILSGLGAPTPGSGADPYGPPMFIGSSGLGFGTYGPAFGTGSVLPLYGAGVGPGYGPGFAPAGIAFNPYALPTYCGGGYALPTVGLTGDEGTLRGAWAQQTARMMTPEYSAVAFRNYVNAQGAAVALLGKAPGEIRPVGPVPPEPGLGKPRQATVLLKSGEKIEGNLVSEDKEWVVIATPTEEVRIRPAEVTRLTIKTGK